MYGDIDPHVVCMEIFTTVWYGDIDRHVTCMETFDTMWNAWSHWLPYDMRGDIDYYVTCMETLTVMWHAWRHWLPYDIHGDIVYHLTCMEVGVTPFCRLSRVIQPTTGWGLHLFAGYLGLYNRQQVRVRLFPYRRRQGARAAVVAAAVRKKPNPNLLSVV